MNKITYKEEPLLFDDIGEFSIESDMNHRRGASFYRTDIIELKLEHKKYFLEIEDFEKYIGTWKTNQYIWADDYGADDPISELIRVTKVEKITYEWV